MANSWLANFIISMGHSSRCSMEIKKLRIVCHLQSLCQICNFRVNRNCARSQQLSIYLITVIMILIIIFFYFIYNLLVLFSSSTNISTVEQMLIVITLNYLIYNVLCKKNVTAAFSAVFSFLTRWMNVKNIWSAAWA